MIFFHIFPKRSSKIFYSIFFHICQVFDIFHIFSTTHMNQGEAYCSSPSGKLLLGGRTSVWGACSFHSGWLRILLAPSTALYVTTFHLGWLHNIHITSSATALYVTINMLEIYTVISDTPDHSSHKELFRPRQRRWV